MSAPALKAVSHRDALSKTVRMLTRDGIEVAFRGHQPMVQTKGNRAFRMVLPELNDTASDDMIAAIHGYLDHELGHILYTPFARATKAGKDSRIAASLINIVEDIRLEKLLPIGTAQVQALPGTKENLERMYEEFIPKMIDPATRELVDTGDPSKQFAGVIVPALRALAGQKPFQAYMDANKFWPHFMPLLSKMPDLSKRLKAMMTFNDVEDIVTDILAALAPPAPPPPPPQPPKQPEPEKDPQDSEDDDDSQDGGDDASDDDDASSEPADDDSDDSEGDGDGDGEGQVDEDADGDDDGDCSGGDEGDDGDGAGGDEEPEDDQPEANGDESEPDDGQRDESEKSKPGDGLSNTSFTDAMKELDPAQRKALFMYKNRKQSVASIATDMQKTEAEVIDLLRTGRKRLGELMKGKRS